MVEWNGRFFDANDVVLMSDGEGGGNVVEGVKVVELGVLTLHVSYFFAFESSVTLSNTARNI